MMIRFQADNDLDERIVVATRRLDPAIDFRTATSLGLHHVPDRQVLASDIRTGTDTGFP